MKNINPLNNNSNSNALLLSSCVDSALSAFSENEQISAAQLVSRLFECHPEYANNGLTKNVKVDETPIRRSSSEWLDRIQSLFDIDKIRTFINNPSEQPTLHGRLAIIGLALLEPQLRQQLEQQEIFKALLEEIREKPFSQILTNQGRLLFNSDSVPNQADNPLEKIDEDMLGRAAFARYLVERIRATSTSFNSGAYAIHLCGSWGSGKSSILNFMKSEMEGIDKKEQNGNLNDINDKDQNDKSEEKIDKWLVVNFNAWRQQHINPPWWPLYDHIYKKIKEKLSIWNRLRECCWRLSTGQPLSLLIFIILFWVLAIVFSRFNVGQNPKAWADAAESISKILALIATFAAGAIGFTRSLFFSSAKAAQGFEEFTHDPMNAIKERFERLLEKLPGNIKLAVFIDDLDRCKSEYVVALLEGIQTLFRQGSVTFVVAADHKWLHACFEQKYEAFKPSVHEPGKPLGTLFLEKAFQLCAPVPGIPKELKADYWRQLIQVKSDGIKQEMEEIRESARERLSENQGDGEIINTVNESKIKPIHEQLTIREEAIVRLASPEVMERTEHILKPFAPLLDDNPRAMKRLVNAYSVNRALAMLTFTDIEQEDLAQWTVLCLRWPQLAEYLKNNPTMVNQIGQVAPANVDENLRYLFNDKDVQTVVQGGGVTNTPLTEDDLKKCGRLK